MNLWNSVECKGKGKGAICTKNTEFTTKKRAEEHH